MHFSKLLDRYYKRPVLYDILLNVLVICGLIGLERYDVFHFDFNEKSNDIATIGLTIAGFILTLLTILLTLKSNSILSSEKDELNAFEIFLASDLYSKSVAILKNGVIILIIVSFVTLGTGTLTNDIYKEFGLYINVVCLLFILLTFLRCFIILNLIFDMQNNRLKD